MKTYLDNLRPMEKRLVVVVGVVLFIVVNAAFVFPHFSDLKAVQERGIIAQRKLVTYQTEIAQMPMYQKQVATMESEGQSVPLEDQASAFQTAVLREAGNCGVQIMSSGHQQTHTNQFFLELSQLLSIQAGEQQLVNFLYNLGSGNSLIRVRDLALHPDAPRYQLSANVKLVASYQKKVPTRTINSKTASTTSSSTAKRP
jgi:hypothetical protein